MASPTGVVGSGTAPLVGDVLAEPMALVFVFTMREVTRHSQVVSPLLGDLVQLAITFQQRGTVLLTMVVMRFERLCSELLQLFGIDALGGTLERQQKEKNS